MILKWEDFRKWFTRDFWKAFNSENIPIRIPPTPKDKEEVLRKVFNSIVSARYSPSIPENEIVINKGHGVARNVPVFCIEDYIVYYFCIKELEEVLCVNRTENTFGGWSLGGKFRRLENINIEMDTGFSSARYSFDPKAWSVAFGEFNSLLYSQLDTGRYAHVLQFDLSNFYDCVRLDILERWIREEANSSLGWVIALLFFFLNQWNRKNTGLYPRAVGLPQDALSDCSRILANYYLQKYDKYAQGACAFIDGLYFRYSDDQMVLLKDDSRTEALMLLLTRNLDRYGLRVNQKKVILWKAKDLEKYRFRKLFSIFSDKSKKSDKRFVRKFVETYLKISDSTLKKSWNQGLPILNHLLWVKLETLPRNRFDLILSRFFSDEYLFLADYKKLLRIYQLNRLRTKPIDFKAHIRILSVRTVHNSFHYEAIKFSRKIKSKRLTDFLEKRIILLDHQFMRSEMNP